MKDYLLPILGVLAGGFLEFVRRITANKFRTKTEETTDAKTEAETVDITVKTSKELVASLREEFIRKDEKIAKLDERITKLEERERHTLTRAAVHEAWDQLALQFILSMKPDFPQPPSLGYSELLEKLEDEYAHANEHSGPDKAV